MSGLLKETESNSVLGCECGLALIVVWQWSTFARRGWFWRAITSNWVAENVQKICSDKWLFVASTTSCQCGYCWWLAGFWNWDIYLYLWLSRIYQTLFEKEVNFLIIINCNAWRSKFLNFSISVPCNLFLQ